MKVSGYFVSPFEIEKCIETHPEVAECAVVGVEDVDGLIKSKAFVTLKGFVVPTPEKGEEIKQFCKTKLASYKFPRFVEFLNSLPKTGLGKVDRFTLKQRGI